MSSTISALQVPRLETAAGHNLGVPATLENMTVTVGNILVAVYCTVREFDGRHGECGCYRWRRGTTVFTISMDIKGVKSTVIE